MNKQYALLSCLFIHTCVSCNDYPVPCTLVNSGGILVYRHHARLSASGQVHFTTHGQRIQCSYSA